MPWSSLHHLHSVLPNHMFLESFRGLSIQLWCLWFLLCIPFRQRLLWCFLLVGAYSFRLWSCRILHHHHNRFLLLQLQDLNFLFRYLSAQSGSIHRNMRLHSMFLYFGCCLCWLMFHHQLIFWSWLYR